MNYCSIEDAWGNNDYITDNFKKYDNKVIEKFENTNEKHENISEGHTNTYETQNINKLTITYSCDEILDHLDKCPVCRQKMRDRYGSKLIEKIQNLINDNKDSIVLVLLALFILVFFNLLISIFKK